nr:MAG TPA: hypothetical protein [Caudoviricetes sp.]
MDRRKDGVRVIAYIMIIIGALTVSVQFMRLIDRLEGRR